VNDTPEQRDIFLCAVWIGAALLIGGLLWFFTQSYRTRLLMEVVNTSLSANGGGRVERQPGFLNNSASVMGGSWFMITNSSDRVFVFAMMHNGVSAACAARVDSSGKVKTIVPLSGNAWQLADGLPLSVYRFYVNRIEISAGSSAASAQSRIREVNR